jgi:hypothetical protein
MIQGEITGDKQVQNVVCGTILLITVTRFRFPFTLFDGSLGANCCGSQSGRFVAIIYLCFFLVARCAILCSKRFRR